MLYYRRVACIWKGAQVFLRPKMATHQRQWAPSVYFFFKHSVYFLLLYNFVLWQLLGSSVIHNSLKYHNRPSYLYFFIPLLQNMGYTFRLLQLYDVSTNIFSIPPFLWIWIMGGQMISTALSQSESTSVFSIPLILLILFSRILYLINHFKFVHAFFTFFAPFYIVHFCVWLLL